jgi:DNA-binding NarL/FixJ family response regulator
MRKTAAVYLLAENRLLREALIRLLSKRSDICVVGANSYSTTVHREIVAARPQIMLMDSSGLESSRLGLISSLRVAIRSLRVLMVDMDSDEAALLCAIRAGVVGYVLKNASALEVAAAIRAVAVGRAVCPPSLCMTLFRYMREQAPVQINATWGSDLGLSRRERETADLLRQRLTNKEIALSLNLSEQTVKNHVHCILRKLGVANRFGIAEFWESRQNVTKLCAVAGEPPEVNGPGYPGTSALKVFDA